MTTNYNKLNNLMCYFFLHYNARNQHILVEQNSTCIKSQKLTKSVFYIFENNKYTKNEI